MPPAIPVNMPEEEPMVAIPVLPVLHVPPGVEDNDVVAPAHMASTPVIPMGNGFTVTTAVVKQPVGNVYVITAVPVVMPVTMPEAEPTVAMPAEAGLQVPPPPSVSVVVPPVQMLNAPLMAAGNGCTVTVVVVKQPVGNV
jgi:hypothetical protein